MSRPAPAGPILVIESDRQLGEAIVEQLAADGYRAALARTSEHARILARLDAPELAVLGWLESPRGALTLLEEIRRPASDSVTWDRELPAIVLGSRARELDVLRAFEAGADDFIMRPAAYLELRARLRAILRRTAARASGERLIHAGPLRIDTHTHTATVDRHPVELRRMEFDLLEHLAREPERVFAKDHLLRTVWGYRAGGSTRTVDTHISRLRRKLTAADGGQWLINVRGVGYRLL